MPGDPSPHSWSEEEAEPDAGWRLLRTPNPAPALALFASALLLLLVVGSVTQRYRPGRIGIALTELIAILLPALLWSRERRQDILSALRLRQLGLRPVLGGVCLGAALFYLLAVWIEPLLEQLIPISERERQQLIQLIRPTSGLRPLWQDLLCFALTPALCEEILFRGAILSTLLAQWTATTRLHSPERPGRTPTTVQAVLICALLFGAFHLSWAKLLPTALLGLGFGAATVMSRSLWSAIAMHFTNNALVVVLIRLGHEDLPLRSFTGPAFGAMLAAASATVVGLALLRHKPTTS
ncbi:MAG TPA: CPBP family intramembrane metalloprotease [Pseudomonadota bacterium]|nr:CPBP family intramembrane metalloprotease [Pseudomonadota bacterium]